MTYTDYKQELINIKSKLLLIKLFNIFKEAEDLSGCIDMFFNNLNLLLGTSITRSGILISNFLNDINFDNLTNQHQFQVYEYISL